MDKEGLRLLRLTAEEGEDGLERLDAVRRGADYWTQVLLRAVTLARQQGASWQQIGKALGVSAQAAHQRFSVRINGE